MSELWIVIPPPRREPEVTLTIAFAVALAVHVFPLIAADPAPPDLGVEIYDEGPCHFGSQLDHESTEICAVTDLSSRFEPVRRPTFDSLIYLDESDCPYCWYGRTWEVGEPQLAEEVRPDPGTIEEVFTNGPIDTHEVRGALQRASRELARCDHTRPSLQLGVDRVDDGTFGATFVIDHGRIAQLITDDTGPTSACVARVLKTIELPEVGEPTPVRVTLRYGTTERSAGVLVR